MALKYDRDLNAAELHSGIENFKHQTSIINDNVWEHNLIWYSKAYSSVLIARFISEFRSETTNIFNDRAVIRCGGGAPGESLHKKNGKFPLVQKKNICDT